MKYLRYPRTKNEMTQYFNALENELRADVKVRGCRKPTRLPDDNDEAVRSNSFSRNWKLFRRRRWKERG